MHFQEFFWLEQPKADIFGTGMHAFSSHGMRIVRHGVASLFAGNANVVNQCCREMCSYFSVQCFSHGFCAFIIQTSKRNARAHKHTHIYTLSLFVLFATRVQSLRRPKKRLQNMFFRSLHSCVHITLRTRVRIANIPVPVPVPYAHSENGVFCFSHYCFDIHIYETL